MAIDISALGSSLTVWEWAGYVATGIVMLGVIGESIVEFTNLIRNERWQSIVGRVGARASCRSCWRDTYPSAG